MKSAVFVVVALVAAASNANALTTHNTTDAAELVAASLGSSSGITVLAGSESLIGSAKQQGTYQDFLLEGSATSGANPLSLNDGIFVTTGGGDFTTTNTTTSYARDVETTTYDPLIELARNNGLNTVQYDSNVLSFNFTLDNPKRNAIRAKFIFASDEYSDQKVSDILGIFVNGVNYAFFPDGELVANYSGDPHHYFNNNEFGLGTYDIEWDGLTNAMDITLLANGGGAVNTFALAIANTRDHLWDSAVFFSGLTAVSTDSSGGVDVPVPLPAAGWLLATALGCIVGRSLRKPA